MGKSSDERRLRRLLVEGAKLLKLGRPLVVLLVVGTVLWESDYYLLLRQHRRECLQLGVVGRSIPLGLGVVEGTVGTQMIPFHRARRRELV